MFHRRENTDEFGHEHRQHDKDRADADDGHDRRISQRRLDLAQDRLFFLAVFGDPVQNLVQDAALLAGSDHAQIKIIKKMRVFTHPFGERLAVLDLIVQIVNDCFKRLVVGLLGDQRKRAQHRHARLDQAGQLPGERIDILRSDFGKPDAGQIIFDAGMRRRMFFGGRGSPGSGGFFLDDGNGA